MKKNNNIIEIASYVTVYTYVNVDTGEVDRVVVMDEDIEDAAPIEKLPENLTPEQVENFREAWQESVWPEWQFGW